MSDKFKNLNTDSLPSHWSADCFGNLVDYKLGKTPPRARSVYWKEGKYPWLSISDVTPHGVVTETAEKVSQEACDAVFRGKLVLKVSLLMSFKLTIGRMSRLGIPAFHNEAIISFQPDPEKPSDDYIRYYLSQINYKQRNCRLLPGQQLVRLARPLSQSSRPSGMTWRGCLRPCARNSIRSAQAVRDADWFESGAT